MGVCERVLLMDPCCFFLSALNAPLEIQIQGDRNLENGTARKKKAKRKIDK